MSDYTSDANQCMYCGQNSGEFASCVPCESKVVWQVKEGGYDSETLVADNPEMHKLRELYAGKGNKNKMMDPNPRKSLAAGLRYMFKRPKV